MKECLSCHAKAEDLLHVCPTCGGTMFLSSSGDAPSLLSSMQQQLQAKEHNDRGGQLMMQGRYAEAEREFRQAVEANPLNATAHSNTGLALFQQGRPEEAIPWLEKALKINPRLGGVPEALAEYKAVAGRTRGATGYAGGAQAPARVRSSEEFRGGKFLLACVVMLVIGFILDQILCLGMFSGIAAAAAWLFWENTGPAKAVKRGVLAGLLAGAGSFLAVEWNILFLYKGIRTDISPGIYILGMCSTLLVNLLIAVLTGALTGYLIGRARKT
jgi:tetratricopeptide (TPR) repeat protein